jgi:TusA-related sulfurtransferase
MPETITIDLKGEICPDPLIQAQSAMKGAASGDTYLIIVDYPLAVDNIVRWAEGEGDSVEVSQKGSEWDIRIVKA